MLLISCAVLFVSLFERCFCFFFFERVSSQTQHLFGVFLCHICVFRFCTFLLAFFFLAGRGYVCTPLEAWTLDMGGRGG